MRRWMLAAAVAALLAAAGCGTDEQPAKGDEASAPIVPKGPVKGDLTIAQWPVYIDPGKRGTVAEFEQGTGVDVKYVEEINDNDEFFGKLRPLLERGGQRRSQPDHGQRLAGGPHGQARLPPALRLLAAPEREAEPAAGAARSRG